MHMSLGVTSKRTSSRYSSAFRCADWLDPTPPEVANPPAFAEATFRGGVLTFPLCSLSLDQARVEGSLGTSLVSELDELDGRLRFLGPVTGSD